jgi:hypothetical protein
MHNLDRSLFEAETASERDPTELEREEFLGILGSLLKGETGTTAETGAGLGELTELELAAELLEVRDEAELDRFLGDLMKRAAGAASDLARSPTGQALGGILKQATKKALPVVGRGIGGWLSPDWAEPGARVGRAAGALLGLELEGLSGEDRELEVARALVRFMDAACRKAAAAAGAPDAPPVAVARKAVQAAARQHAPGLLAAAPGPNGSARPGPGPTAPAQRDPAAAGSSLSGRWQRRGRTIVIFDA